MDESWALIGASWALIGAKQRTLLVTHGHDKVHENTGFSSNILGGPNGLHLHEIVI